MKTKQTGRQIRRSTKRTDLGELVARALRRTPTFVAPLFGVEEFTRAFFAELAALARTGKRVRLPALGVFYVHRYPSGTSVLKFSASKGHRGIR